MSTWPPALEPSPASTPVPSPAAAAYGVIAGLGSYLFLYIFFTLHDLALAAVGWSDLTIREVLEDATPDAFRGGDDVLQ